MLCVTPSPRPAVLLCLGLMLVLLLKEAQLRKWVYAVAATSG
jgi:hypothetical protein